MKKLRWQFLVVALTLIVVAILLLTQQQPSLNPIQPQPASGGIYTEALVGAFGRLNPMLDLNNPADREVDRLLFSSLLKFDSRGIPQSELAESWGVSADGKIYNVVNKIVEKGDQSILYVIHDVSNGITAPIKIALSEVKTVWTKQIDGGKTILAIIFIPLTLVCIGLAISPPQPISLHFFTR